jgi:hypothetical protein
MGAAISNAKWLMFNDLEDMKHEMDVLLKKMNLNLEERRKLHATKQSFDRDMKNMRSSSIMNAEILESTKETMNHNVNDLWNEVQQLSTHQNTLSQTFDVKLDALKSDLQKLKDQSTGKAKIFGKSKH